MWMTEASATTVAKPEAVWRLWSNVDNWSVWDPGLACSRLDGEFVAGARGALKPAGGPKVSFTLTSVRPGVSFADRTHLPLARIDFLHELAPDRSGTRITHRIEIAGPLAALFGRLLGPNLSKGLPEAVSNLARLAEGGMQ